MQEYTGLARAGGGSEFERLELLEEHRRTVRSQLAGVRSDLEAIDQQKTVYRERIAP